VSYIYLPPTKDKCKKLPLFCGVLVSCALTSPIVFFNTIANARAFESKLEFQILCIMGGKYKIPTFFPGVKL